MKKGWFYHFTNRLVYIILGMVFVASCGSDSTNSAIGQLSDAMINAANVMFDAQGLDLPDNVQEAMVSLALTLQEVTNTDCPDDMNKIGSVCIDVKRDRNHLNPENGLDNRVTYKTATLACQDAGKRLCRVDELRSACYQGAIDDMNLAVAGVPHEWTSDFTDTGGGSVGQRTYTMFGATNGGQPPTECRSMFKSYSYESLPGDGSTYINEFRCCQDAKH